MTANIAFDCEISPEALVLEGESSSSTSINSDGAATQKVSHENINATITISNTQITYNPFVIYSDNIDDLSTENDDLLFGINFLNGSVINSQFGNFSNSECTSFTSRRNQSVIQVPSGSQTTSYAYLLNLSMSLFNSISGVDILKVPSNFHQDNEDKSNQSFSNILEALDGIWVDKNGLIKYAKGGSNYQVGDTISSHPCIIFFNRSISQFASYYSDLPSLKNELGVYSNLVTNDYSENNIFNIVFQSDEDYCYCYSFELTNPNQLDLTNSGSSISDRSIKVSIALIIT